MNKKSITSNYFYNITYQILVILIPIITTPYISRVLHAEGVGKYSFSYSIVSYFMLLAVLGTSTYAQREIAFGRDDKKRTSISFFEIIIFRCLTTIISFIAYMCIVFFVVSEDRHIYLIQGGYILAVALDITWFFQGLEEFRKIVIRNLIIKVISLLYIFIFIKEATDLYLYILGLVVFTVLGNLSIWFYLPMHILIPEAKSLRPFHDLKSIIELFIPTVAIQIYTIMDKSMIGFFTGQAAENGYYEQSEKIVKMALTLITSLGIVMIPRVSYIFEKNDFKKIKEVIYRSYRFVWFLGIPIFLGIIALSDYIVVWFLGPGYEKCALLIRIFSVLIWAIGINNVTGMQYLIPVKKQNIFTGTVTLGAAVNFLLNLCLIPRYFSIGAAIASVIAETTITVVQIIYVVRGVEQFSIKQIFNGSLRYLFSGLLMFISILFFKRFLAPTLWNTLLLAGLGAIEYMLLMIIEKDEFIQKIRKLVFKKSKKCRNNE